MFAVNLRMLMDREGSSGKPSADIQADQRPARSGAESEQAAQGR